MCLLAIVWLLYMFWGALFNGGYPYNFYGMMLYAAAFIITLSIYLIIFYTKYRSK